MGISVLVVDDDLPSARAIASLLERAECSVLTSTDPESAIALALDAGVDMVTLDIRMPALDGFEVLSLVRSHEHSRRARSVPVVAITGEVGAEARARTLAGGFAAHLGKPVLVNALQEALGHVASLRAQPSLSRYSVDQAGITGRVERMLRGGDGQAAQAVAGLALAIEQQGVELLRAVLLHGHRGEFQEAIDGVARLVDMGEAVGALHFCALAGDLIAALDARTGFERPAVLLRAELDRIVYTLREQVLTRP